MKPRFFGIGIYPDDEQSEISDAINNILREVINEAKKKMEGDIQSSIDISKLVESHIPSDVAQQIIANNNFDKLSRSVITSYKMSDDIDLLIGGSQLILLYGYYLGQRDAGVYNKPE